MRHRYVFLIGLFLIGAACTSGTGDERDAAPRRNRDAGMSSNMNCIRCSMLSQILVSGGGPMGGMDPCAGGGSGGGPGGFTFCNQAVFDSFIGCLQAQCGGACPLGAGMGMGMDGGMMCSRDGGATPSPDAGAQMDGGVTADAGVLTDAGSGGACAICITTRCAAEYAQCGADR